MEETKIFDFHGKSSDFLNDLLSIDDRIKRKLEIRRYIERFDTDQAVLVPDFQTGWQWFNVENPLSLQGNLRGKLLVLDFFTYCCINCMHILPDLEALERVHKITDGVIIIGVHSAKFDNERVSDNILSAVLRYNITHPVVNDKQAKLWQDLQIQCWPTLAVVSPNGYLLFLLSGEGHREILTDFVSEALSYYKEQGDICDAEIGLKLAKDGLAESFLRFPGKVCVDHEARRLAISDTGHHRIIVTDKNGIIQHIVGGTEPGFKDGCFNYAKFRSPQGLCFRGDKELYVADTENHAIRKIDLKNEMVCTLAGTGSQGNDQTGGDIGQEQAISSPWDVVITPDNADVLYIAMAGTHQIWSLYIKDSTDIKGSKHKAGTCLAFAGSGNEENRNNNYPHRAAFAQPSGLAVGRIPEHSTTHTLVVADSESSTVRALSLKDGSVKGLVGGDIDPTNLFAFGDVDGKGNKARLQHPLGVGVIPGSIIVADSYNHKIKLVNPLTKSCTTILGSGSPGKILGLSTNHKGSVLNEPGGLAVHPNGDLVYIADTNNHCIKVMNIDSQELSELPVIQATDKPDGRVKRRRIPPSMAMKVGLNPVTVCSGQTLDIRLCVTLPESFGLNREAPNMWALHSDDARLESVLDDHFGQMTCVTNTMLCSVTLPKYTSDCTETLQAHTGIFLCHKHDDTCNSKALVFTQPLHIIAGSRGDSPVKQVLLQCEI